MKRQRDVTLFWIAIATAVGVAVWRVVASVQSAGRPSSEVVSYWIENAFVLWSLTLLVLAWLSWRDSQRRAAELETIIASVSPDVLLVVNPDRTVRTCNPAVKKLFGYEPAEVIGQKTELLYSDRRDADDSAGIRDALQKFGSHVGTATGHRKDGSLVPLQISTGKLLENSGAVIVIRDITERKRLEQLREDLVHMLVHDLKNPLTVISICLDTAKESFAQGLPPDPQWVIHARQVTSQMCTMVHSLLDTTKLERSELRLERAPVDLVPLARETATMFASSMRDKNITLQLPEGSSPATCDREIVGRILANLLANSVKFTDVGGTIQISVQATAAGTKVSVRDTGRGIPAEYLDKVFERFAQVETHRFSYGLGLAFCKLAVEAHGGTIGVESAVGRGSIFWFVLPHQAPSAAEPPSAG